MEAMDEAKKKKTLGRRKIEIKKVESMKARYVHFSKRRASLFRKASELSIICGADIAIAALSCGGRLFTFGDLDAVAARYLEQIDRTAAEEGTAGLDGGATEQQQEVGDFWWENVDVEGKSMEELKELASRLTAEKENLVRRVTEYLFPNPTVRDAAAMADAPVPPVSEQEQEQGMANLEQQQHAGRFL